MSSRNTAGPTEITAVMCDTERKPPSNHPR